MKRRAFLAALPGAVIAAKLLPGSGVPTVTCRVQYPPQWADCVVVAQAGDGVRVRALALLPFRPDADIRVLAVIVNEIIVPEEGLDPVFSWKRDDCKAYGEALIDVVVPWQLTDENRIIAVKARLA